MPFDVSGNFTRAFNFQLDRDNAIKITASRVDGEFDNFATGMNIVFFRDGRVPMSADLRMNLNRISGIADGTVAAPSLKFNGDAATGPYLDGVSRYAITVAGTRRFVATVAGVDVTGNLTTTGNVAATGTVSAGGQQLAPLASPTFTGVPLSTTPATADNTTKIATTAYVQANLVPYSTTATIAGIYAPLASPTFTGAPLSTTPATADNTTKIATTAFVQANLVSYAPLASPTFTGAPLAPTPSLVDNTTKIATTAFVQGQAYATLASPQFTGVPLSVTPTTADNTTKIATTAYVQANLVQYSTTATIAGIYAPLASPALTGNPTAPTQAVGDSSTKLATTAFVQSGKIPQIQAVASAATVTPTFSNDMVKITALAAACQLLNWTGTAIEGWGIVVRIKDNGTARALTYDTKYRGVGVALPAITIVNKTLYLGFVYNITDDKFDLVTLAQE